MNKNDLQEFVNFFDELKANGPLKRLGKLFHTRDNGYIYDLGTGKILLCTPDEYEVLNNIVENDGAGDVQSLGMNDDGLLECLRVLKKTIVEEKLLQAPPLTEFASSHSQFELVKEQIESNLQQITLEVTQNCNLRCKYCIYSDDNDGFRDFDTHDMTWDIAKKAIDYGIAHSREKLSVSFYGGEPLLKFELIKKCVEYSRQVAEGRVIRHSMTTNMTLMTKEIAEYLASIDQFTVVCSLDGPKEIHDENRLTIDGNGSFDRAIKGLRYLVDAYGDRAETHLSLSMVMTLPADDEKLKRIQDFFSSLEWLPSKMTKNISYVVSSSHRMERLTHNTGSKNTAISEYINPLADWSQDNSVFSSKIDDKDIFTNSFMQSAYLKIHKRMIVNNPIGCYNLSGCCIPASRRLYITATGKFLLCEKIGNAPYIGDVDNGIDLESIKKNYLDDYMDEAKKLCSNCWAVRFCGNCYVDCYDSNGFVPEFKRDRCGAALYGIEKQLINYHEMMERHPERLEYLNDIIVG